MRQTFIKDGIVRSFEVKNGKVITTIKIDGGWCGNPTLEQFYAAGWEDYVPHTPEPPSKEEQYRQRVVELIREEYSQDDEFAIHRRHFAALQRVGVMNLNAKSNEEANTDDRFDRYNDYCEYCEERAHREIYGDSDDEEPQEPQVRR